MKAVVTFGAVPIVLLLAGSSSSAQPQTTATEIVREIDWNAIGPGSPIPDQIPAGESADPLEAGFARQWLERVEYPGFPDFAWRQLALAIASGHRTPDDHWAAQMEKELRGIVHDKVQTGRNLRVFCNSFGCLCYVERDERFARDPLVYLELVGKRRRELGLNQSDLDATVHPVRPGIPWELTVVKRPSSGVSVGTSHAPKSASP